MSTSWSKRPIHVRLSTIRTKKILINSIRDRIYLVSKRHHLWDMDTSSDSEGALSPGSYDQVAYNAVTSITGYDGPAIIKSPSRHSESSDSGSDVAEPRGALVHHKFSIDRILGRFNGGDAAAATTIDSCPETSDPGNRHRNDLAFRGVGECNHTPYFVVLYAYT